MIRKRTTKTLLAAAIALQATLVHALGLGDITLRSALDEPLDAEIRLRGVGDLNANQIVVHLASAADFERAGVERLYSLTEMRFEVELLPNGEGRLHVRTERPMREPYLDFVVEVRWPAGRVLREYTVLLDLPTTTAAPAPVVHAPAVSRPAAARGSARPATAGSAGGGTWSGGDSYPVRSGDTLWSIANRTRPAGVSVQQMMVALQRDNPDAFIRGNMNLLRAGAVLRVPSGAAVSQSEALGEIEAQGRDWRSGGEPLAQESRATAQAGGAATPAERAYLELAAGTAQGSGAATGGVEGGTGSAPLTEQLTTTQENLAAKEREAAELQSRVAALEEQVKNYERLVELKSEGGAAAQQAAGAPPPQPSGEPAPSAGEQAAQPPAEPAAKAPAPAPIPEPGLLDQLMGNTLVLGGAIAALFLGALGFLFLRRREHAVYGDVPEPAHVQRAVKAAARKETPAESPEAFEPTLPAAGAAAAAAVPAAAAPPAVDVVARPAPVAAPEVEPDHGDPIGEAEIFVAYGRTERAVEVLRSALAMDPARGDVRFKLMDLLADADDEAGFLAEYDRLVVEGDAAGEKAAREMLVSKGLAHWLTDIDQPAGLQSYSEDQLHVEPPAAVVAAEPAPAETHFEPEVELVEPARMEVEGDIAHLDAEIDLDADLAQASAEADALDHELSLEIGDLDLGADLGELDAAPAGQGTVDLDLDLGALEPEPEQAGEGAAAEYELDIGDLGELGELGELGDVGGPGAEPEPERQPDAVPEPVLAAPAAVGEAHAASAEDEADLGLLDGSDEIETKLELARAYVDMGDLDGARDILDEVLAEGSGAQREQANGLLERIRGG